MSSRVRKSPLLERDLSRLLSLLLLLVLLVLLGIAAWLGRESAIQFSLSRLHHDAEAIISNLDIDKRSITGSLPPIYRQPLSGHYFVVRFADGEELRSRSLWDEPFGLPESPVSKTRYWLAPGPQDQELLIWQSAYQKDGKHFSITVAEDVAALLSAIWRFILIGVIASIAAVLIMLLLQRLIIRRAFSRLDRVRDDIREVRKGSRGEVRTDVPAEVLPMVTEFNQLLHVWRKHQQRSRNAAGNLAHALKTPLQVIRRHGEQQGETVVLEQSRRMQLLIEQELKRARITGRAAVGRHFRPRQDMDDLKETLNTLYHQKALHIDLVIEAPETLYLDQNDMLELLGNLLDNAAKWADKEVRVSLHASDELRIVVEDDGPGIEADQRELLLHRGIRLDENQPGHGLGLAIVGDIVTQYEGSIELGESSILGGVRVTVVIPVN
jgi:signal transduction histidine kinase